jgi:hypothetical protein
VRNNEATSRAVAGTGDVGRRNVQAVDPGRKR